MTFVNKWLNLQLFAGEGAGDGAGSGAGGNGGETGVPAADPGRQRLLELGVPASKIRDRASKAVARMAASRPEQQANAPAKEQTAPATNTPTEDADKKDTQAKPTWEDLMKDPDYNKRMQETVQTRLRGAKLAEDAMGKMAPALELLARKYGLDPEKPDYDALAKAISDDDSYYEDKAVQMGVSVGQAKQMDQAERDNARRQRQEAVTLEQQRIQNHIRSLEQQGEKMKAVFPNFDLRKELENPVFFRMTSPNMGISVEDAYYAVHRKEIEQASMQAAVNISAQKLSRAYQSGSMRPKEAGTSGNAPSVTTTNYKAMSKEQREDLKQRIRMAAARGEKIYPGM